MSHNQSEKLVKMANQIGQFFASQKHIDSVAATAEHLSKFWDPRMRKAICEHVSHGGEGLDPVTLDAVKTLAKHAQLKAAHTGEVRPGQGGADG
jgi:formate dehydrogenase subunit delta